MDLGRKKPICILMEENLLVFWAKSTSWSFREKKSLGHRGEKDTTVFQGKKNPWSSGENTSTFFGEENLLAFKGNMNSWPSKGKKSPWSFMRKPIT